MAINEFKGKYNFLSNFYNAPVFYNGIRYQNNEAAFQAQKDLSRSHEFANLPPNKAKVLGRKVKLRSDWEDIKIQIMEEIVRAKFEQNNDLKKRLLNTGNKILIEGNWWNDKFWGVCNGEGKNELGKILMKVREELRTKEQDK